MTLLPTRRSRIIAHLAAALGAGVTACHDPSPLNNAWTRLPVYADFEEEEFLGYIDSEELNRIQTSYHSNWCNPPNEPDTYDAFPGTGYYPSGPASAEYPWPGENFELYPDNDPIECGDNDAMNLDVTAGCLYSTHNGPHRRGWTYDATFRMLAVGWKDGRRIEWTDQAPQYRAYIKNWIQADDHPRATDGLHLFFRYRTENDLYVASLRHDGLVTVKRKYCGTYATLASEYYGPPSTRTWYWLKVVAFEDYFDFYVNNERILHSVYSPTFSWGTTGIRTDYVDVYFDDWSLQH